MIVKIPLDGGLVTQVDPEDIGASACTELVNLELDKPGLIYKRKGFGEGFNVFPAQKVYSLDTELVDMVRWYNKNIYGDYYWISTFKSFFNGSYYLSYWYSSSGSSWTPINTVDESSDVITTDLSQVGNIGLMGTIKDFNNQLRFVNGLHIDSQVYQYIDRGFFWGTYPGLTSSGDKESYTEFLLDKARPRDILSENLILEAGSSTLDVDGKWFYKTSATGYDLNTTKYYYKYTLVFDGLQESPISEKPAVELGATSSSNKVIPYIDFEIQAGSSDNMELFNKRVTAINIYRSSSANGSYSKIGSVSTLANDPNLKRAVTWRPSGGSGLGRVSLSLDRDIAKDDYNNKIFLDYNKNAKSAIIKTTSTDGILELKDSTDADYNFSVDQDSTGVQDPQALTGTASGTNYTPVGSGVGTETVAPWSQWGSEISYRPTTEGGPNISETGSGSSFSQAVNNQNLFRSFIVDSLVGGSGVALVSNAGEQTIHMSTSVVNHYGNSNTLSFSNDQTSTTYWYPDGYAQEHTHVANSVGSSTFKTENLTLEGSTDYIFVGWISTSITASGSRSITIRAKTSSGVHTSDGSGIKVAISLPNSTMNDVGHADARWFQYCLPFKTDGAGAYCLEFKMSFNYYNSDIGEITRWSGLKVGKQLTEKKPEGISYYGGSLLIADSGDFGSTDDLKGNIYIASHNNYFLDKATEKGYILNNTNKVIRPYVSGGDEPAFPIDQITTPVQEIAVCSNYYFLRGQVPNSTGFDIESFKNSVKLRFFDKDLIDGAYHPYGAVSLDVKYKYSKFMNGRNYVANVKISKGEESEEHGNWVMFSELNQPDVIPITNFIQLSDAQGGDIIGMESLLGDLVVFMERGIYRLSIPSADPTAWSLSEAEENIGCAFEGTITPWEAGVFFCAKDHIYFLDANFQAQPVTKTIQDDYKAIVKGASKKGTKLTYDPGKNKLWFYGTEKEETQDEIYYLDLSVFPKERWAKMKPGSIENTATGHVDTEGTINLPIKKIVIAENLTAGHIGNRIFTQFVPAGFQFQQYINFDSGIGDETLGLQRKTGWISGPDLGTRIHVRKLNLKYKGSSFQVKFYADGNSNTVVRNITIPTDTSGEDWYRCVPGIRCRSFMIEIYGSQTDTDREIRRMEIEYE